MLTHLDDPSPPSPGPDSRREVARRVARLRLRRRLVAAVSGGIGAIAIVTVIVLVVRTLPSRRVAVIAGPTTTIVDAVVRIPMSSPTDIAVGAGAVWTVGRNAAQAGRESWYLARLNRVTGVEVSRTELHHPAQRVAVGDGVVWVAGSGDSAYPDGGVTAVDAASGRVAATWGYNQRLRIAAIAATASTAWVSVPSPPSLVRLDLSGRNLRTTTIALSGQPANVVVSDGHTVLVSIGPTTAIQVETTANRVVATPGLPGWLLAAGNRRGLVWTSDNKDQVLIEVDTNLLSVGLSVAEGVRIPNLVATKVATTPDGGILVLDSAGGVDDFAATALTPSTSNLALLGSDSHRPQRRDRALHRLG